MMNILHINTNYLSNALHQNMISSLESQGVRNSVFVPTYQGSMTVITPGENVLVAPCFKKIDRINYYSKQKKIISAVKRQYDITEFDCIHAYTVFTDGNVAYKLHKEYGIPYVVAVRNTDINTFFKYMLHLRKRGIEILKNASAVFFLSKVYKDRLFDKYIKPNDASVIAPKCHIMPNGADEFWLNNLYSEKIYETSEVIKVACVGSIESNKNMLSVAKALAKLRSEGRNVQLYIAGRVKDEGLFESLSTFDFVHYEGVLVKEKLIELYRKTDLFAMVSFKESFGMVYIEAMSQALPVVYTKGEGFDGQFEEGTVGYAAVSSDVDDIYRKIKLVYEQKEILAKNAVSLVGRYSWDAITDRYCSIYKKLV